MHMLLTSHPLGVSPVVPKRYRNDRDRRSSMAPAGVRGDLERTFHRVVHKMSFQAVVIMKAWWYSRA